MGLYCVGTFLWNENDSEKRKNSSFLIVKMYEITFCQQLLARVCSTKQEHFVWTRKGVLNKRYYPENWPKYEIIHIYFSRLLLKFLNHLLLLKCLWMTFGMTFGEHLRWLLLPESFISQLTIKVNQIWK